MASCFKNMKKSNKISNKISNLEDIFEPRLEGFTEPVSILKNGTDATVLILIRPCDASHILYSINA